MPIESLAQRIISIWMFAGFLLFLYSWLNVPVLLLFFFHRRSQILDPRFDLRATTPTHTLLQLFCVAMYGLLMPAFYFLTVRTRHELAQWPLGSGTNTRWTIALGALSMTWLAAHGFEAVLRAGRPRFGKNHIDRLLGGLALGLCVWFHFKTIPIQFAQIGRYSGGSTGFPAYFFAALYGVIYPQSCFLGATLVYGLAFLESLHAVPAAYVRRKWRSAIPLAVAFMLIIFAPFWLSIPRVTHRQALALIQAHRAEIAETARLAELDPRLLAGIIYVAQTRDHPRLMGDYVEKLALSVGWEQSENYFFGLSPLINPSAGLCQIRPVTAAQTLGYVKVINNRKPGLLMRNRYSSKRWFKIRIPSRIAKALLTNIDWDVSMTRHLLNPSSNLATAALMLTVFREQWRKADFPIDERPEILATLYNIGYRNSHPKGDPKANDFGRRVKTFMESETARRLFPSPGEDAHGR